ncbi:MAG: VTT domain-containing protein, partial [Thioalkalispiraceae bacterium]
MSFEPVQTILDWLQTHSVLATLIVFLTALTESLAVVGLLVPGAVLMVIFGALIATGHLQFSHVFIAACAGAIVGDGISYWLGKNYQQQLARLWPLSRHPELINKGQAFFTRHGGKSILLGRFVGPIRPIIPAIAGMMNMRFSQFTTINVLSALLWAPLYLLPGILLGTSLELASELAGRFALLLLLLLFCLWLSYQVIAFLYRKITPHTDRLLYLVTTWNKQHPLMAQLTSSVIDPNHREVRGLTLLVLLLFLSSLVTALLFTYALKTGPLQNLNMLVFNGINYMQSPPFDWVMQWFSRLGEHEFLYLVVTLFGLWLAWQRNWVSIIYLLSALLAPLAIIIALSWTQALPQTLFSAQQLSGFNIPSAHTALSISTYGFIAIILSRQFSAHLRLIIYIGIAWLAGMIGFSRLYFATHLLTDVIGGFLLGFAWLCIIAIAYRRHNRDALITSNKFLPGSLILVLLVISYPYQSIEKTYAEPRFEQHYVINKNAWLDSGWQTLPAIRQDLKAKHQHPLNLQWAGEPHELEGILLAQGWHNSAINSLKLVQWFNPAADIEQLPLLPQVHEGRYDDIRLFKVMPDRQQLLVLRLWQSDTLLKQAQEKQRIWIGNVSFVK